MNYAAFGEALRTHRKRQHLTQEEVAEKADISASFLGHLERGTRVASIDTLLSLCNALAVTPNDLLACDLTASPAELPEEITISPRALLQRIAQMLQKQEFPG